MAYIGIDFGTSNSVVANFRYGQAEVVPNQEGHKWTPSVVTLRRDGSLAFGQEAKENFDEQRSIRSSKRIGKLGGDDIDILLGNVLARRFQEKTGFDVLNSPYKQQFMLAVEKAKIDLSNETSTVARKAELVPERHLSLEEEIDRHALEREIMPPVVKSGTASDEATKW